MDAASASNLTSSTSSTGARLVWRGMGLPKIASVIKAFIDKPDFRCRAYSSPRKPSGGLYEIGAERFLLFFGSVIPFTISLVLPVPPRVFLAPKNRRGSWGRLPQSMRLQQREPKSLFAPWVWERRSLPGMMQLCQVALSRKPFNRVAG